MSLHTLILAAGGSSRFGVEPKQLAQINGQTMLERSIKLATSVSKTTVVLGCEYQRLAPLVNDADLLIHSGWQAGLGSSIAFGVAALPSHISAVLLLLCDQVAITADDLRALVEHYKNTGSDAAATPIICASYAGRLGVPAIFPRYFFPQLMSLHGDIGAKKILENNSVLSVSMDAAAIDIDTQESLTQFIQGS